MPRPRSALDLRRAAQALAADASMAQVAAELGIAKPTLFKLAGSRAELHAACVDAEAERLVGRLASLPETAGAGGPRAWLEAVTGALDGLALPLLAGSRPALRRVEDRLGAVLRRAGAVPDGLAPEEAAAALLGAALALRRRRAP